MATAPQRFYYLPETPPGQVSGNSYTDLMIRCWKHAGYEHVAMPRGLRAVLKAVRDRGRTTCVANWVEMQIVSKEGKVHLRGLLGYLKAVVKLHLLAKHLVFFRHDVYPHSTKGKSRAIAKAIVDLSETLLFDKVLVHSDHYRGRFRKCLPHPIYDFGGAETTGPASTPSDDLIYFGNFGPYKRLDLLIQAWHRPSRLIIAGGCSDGDYLASLVELARGKNIEFVTHWLGDEEAMTLVRSCAAMVVPQSAPSYIISSTLYFALSCGVPAICNRSPHARGLAGEGFPGIICIEDLSELNSLDIAAIRAIDRREIERATRARCGTEAVSALIQQHV